MDRKTHEQAAESNFDKIVEDFPWVIDIPSDAARIVNENASVKAKIAKFYALADKIGMAIAPSAVCAEGCSHCCNISVSMSQFEADKISSEIGVRAKQLRNIPEPDEAADKYFGVPCTFLKNGRCSIYESRPFACRLHFNIGSSSSFCGIDIKPKDSSVPNLDLQAFWLCLAAVLQKYTHGDIREFFPITQESGEAKCK